MRARTDVLPAAVRLLDDRDLLPTLDLLAADPIDNAFVASRVESLGLDPRRLGAEVWGYFGEGGLAALCYAGANLVPYGSSPPALRGFAQHARRQGRRCSSMVGPSSAVDPLWRLLRPVWGPARDVRLQPLMAISAPARVPADPGVRRVVTAELDVLLPACVAMFTEEVGISPTAGDGGALYRTRVAELIATGRAFARIEDGRVLFKAEIGALSRAACQVQGVWVDPALRGTGLGTAGMAAVVDEILGSVSPVVSLYVNDYNEPARRAYERVGFTQVGRFTSVLF
jgi:predicted GNAT family acetyltransferase